MKIGISIGLHKLPLFDDLYRDFSINHIQLGAFSPDKSDLNEMIKIISLFRANYPDIEISHHAYPYNLAEKVDVVRKLWVDLAKRNIEFAQQIGCSFVNLHLGAGIDAAKREDRGAILETIVVGLSEIVDLAHIHRMQVHIENLYPEQRCSDFSWIGDRTSDFDFVFENIKSDNLKLCYDYGHGNLDEHGIDILKKHAGRLGSTHSHDNDQISDIHWPIGVEGRGTINWEAEVEYLKNIAFDGPFILESYYEDQIQSLNYLHALGIV